ncbi:sulfatase-like hydrolase/transferase [Persicitalea jodogahamensis]|uniref:N-sulfoglucosamine sulfohydrolase n=1 Tax=Persicitalea jodogahamensis TaxID=402147 RepID=A0A8J3D3G2_9BACT|nr:sulfatase-like hydrolase/transferase [Persicitalea jodogahamensis]GHB64801.1 N-sulfoglucosamine sulfohydrolase [Persicitalea jodogahamensis]
MKKFTFLFALLLNGSLLLAQSKPNIVFLLADDCSSWDIGVYGSKDSKTPTIDRLASEGMRFTKCYQSSPMCSPTRQNILTGLSPFRSGAYPNHTNVNANVKSIAHYLKPLGYRVALGGKQHYGPAENFPLEYLGKAKGRDSDPDFGNIDRFLNSASTEKQPFCLFVCSNQPHSPWNRGDTTLFDKNKIKLPPFYADLPQTREDFRDYLAEVNYLDGQVKQTLDLLEKYHLSDNTIFVFASEQGNSFPFSKWTCYNVGLKSALIVRWPGKVQPNTVSDALVEYSDITPTFIDMAGGEAVDGLDGESLVPVLTGQKTEHKQYTYGQMTTRGIIRGSEYYPIRSVSNGKFRYIVNLTPEVEFRNVINASSFFEEWVEDARTNPGTKALVHKHGYRPPEELYDDETDPYNQHNLIADGKLAAVKAELKEQLRQWMEHTGDRGILTELLALEHMPGQKSGYPVIVDTTPLRPSAGKGGTEIKVPADGYYTFYLLGKGELKIDDVKIVEANGSAKEADERYGVAALAKGTHRVVFSNVESAKVNYSGPVTPRSYLNGEQVKGKKNTDESEK